MTICHVPSTFSVEVQWWGSFGGSLTVNEVAGQMAFRQHAIVMKLNAPQKPLTVFSWVSLLYYRWNMWNLNKQKDPGVMETLKRDLLFLKICVNNNAETKIQKNIRWSESSLWIFCTYKIQSPNPSSWLESDWKLAGMAGMEIPGLSIRALMRKQKRMGPWRKSVESGAWYFGIHGSFNISHWIKDNVLLAIDMKLNRWDKSE